MRGRKNQSLSQALQRWRDPELADLYDQLAERRERVASLELELFEARAELARFEAEYESRLGPLEARLAELRQELKSARRRATHRAVWGDRWESREATEDVLEQFERTWRSTGAAPGPSKAAPAIDEASRGEIKQLYRLLAKRFHPDLTVDPQEKAWREEIMAQVNRAYAEENLAKLRELQSLPDRPQAKSEQTRDQIIIEVGVEIRRLDGVIRQLESTLRQLTHSPAVQLKLDASIARSQGRDLLGEIARQLRREIAEVEAELASLGPDWPGQV